MDPTYPLYPVLTFIAFILVLIPLPWHLEAWNTGTCLYMIWAAVAILNQFINSIVWHNNALNPAPVFCDIADRIIIGASVAIPAASLCINRRLYQIASIQAVTTSKAEKRRAIIVDLCIGLGIPVMVMTLQYVVQGHRSNIFEDIGCQPATFDTPLAYVLVWMWPVVLGLVSMVYCSLTLRAFITRRSQFNEFLASNKSITFSRYFRLMALAATEMSLTVPLGILTIWLNATDVTVFPWRGWHDTHWGFSRIEQVPRVLWQTDHWTAVSFDLQRWLTTCCGFLFFAFFGFAEESRKNYRIAFWSIAKRFGYSPSVTNTYVNGSSYATPKPPNMSGSHGGTLPVFVSQRPQQSKRESFLSSVGDLSSSITIGSFEDTKGSFSTASVHRISIEYGDLPQLAHIEADPALPALPAPVLNPAVLPQHPVDAPSPVRPPRPDSLDIV